MAVTTTVQVTLPAMGESVTEGTVLEWHKAGGRPRRGGRDPRRDLDRQGRRRGPVARRRHRREDPRRRRRHRRGRRGARRDPAARRRRAGGARTTRAGNGAAAAPARRRPPTTGGRGAGEIVDIVTPGAGESVTEGTLLEWHVEAGGAVADGDTIVEISTDKVDVELPAPAAGVITELLAAEGDTVTVGQVIARMRLGAGAARAGGASAPAATAPPPPRQPRRTAAAPAPDGLKVSPVAARVAAAEGVNLDRASAAAAPAAASRRPTCWRPGTAAPPPRPPPRTSQPIRGAAAMLARYMDESRSIPTATSFRTITVTQMDGRRKQLKDAGQKVSFTHLIAYAIAKATARVDAGHGPPLRRGRRQAAAHRRRRREPRHRRRRREEGRLAHADGAGDPRRRPHELHGVQGRLRRADRQGAHEHAVRRRPAGREHLADQPGRHRHGRLGAAADGRPGHDRRDRLDRLPGRPGQRRRAARRREGHDDDLDLRPPHHPGRGVGPLPADRRGLPAGRARVLRGRLRRPRRAARPGRPSRPAAARRRAPPRRPRRRRDGAAAATTSS